MRRKIKEAEIRKEEVVEYKKSVPNYEAEKYKALYLQSTKKMQKLMRAKSQNKNLNRYLRG
jgi:hypothetical protein